MNKRGARPYCKLPALCAAGTRGPCAVCHAQRKRHDAIAARYDNGNRTMTEVGAYFGISRQRVGIILREAGVIVRPRHRSRTELTRAQYRRFRTLCHCGIPAAVAHEEVRR
jgi:hypothetical protein